MCHRCGHQVQRMEREDCPASHIIRFTVHCHGQTEITEIKATDLALMAGPDPIQPGVAFAPDPGASQRRAIAFADEAVRANGRGVLSREEVLKDMTRSVTNLREINHG